MAELFKNAWMGWKDIITADKYIAFLLCAFAAGLLSQVKLEGKKKSLVIYSVLMMALLICPLTAGALMVVQTRFYDYNWLWVMVPIIPIIAWMCAEIFYRLPDMLKDYKCPKYKFAAGIVLMLCILLVSGDLVKNDIFVQTKDYTQLYEYLNSKNEDIYLLASREVLENARAHGNYKLLYGKNMWDKASNAYTYDTYSEDVIEIYKFIEGNSFSDEETNATMLQAIEEKGVNCIIVTNEKVALIELLKNRFQNNQEFDGVNIFYLE